jgi:uncharacterized protein (TIGR00304 family)
MRPLRILAAFVILAGVALLIYSVAIGEMQVALVLIVPVIFGGSILGVLAIGLIIAGVFVFIADSFLGARSEGEPDGLSDEGYPSPPKIKGEFGGVVFIGPIPIIFGSSKKVTIYAVILSIVVFLLIVMGLFLASS